MSCADCKFVLYDVVIKRNLQVDYTSCMLLTCCF